MPIFFEEPRPSIVEVLKSEVEDIVSKKHVASNSLLQSNTIPLSFVAPHRIYHLSSDDIGESNFLARASLYGWRYLIEAGQEVIASAQWHYNHDGTSGRFGSFNDGMYDQSTRKAMDLVHNSPEFQSGHYQPHLLACFGLLVMALWLQHSGEDRSRDLYIPLDRTWEPLVAYTVMAPDDFAEALVTMKERRRPSAKP